MNRRAWLLISVSFMIVVNSSIGSDANQGSASSPGTAIIAVNDYNFPGTTSNVGHVAVLFENPKDNTYKFVSVQAEDQNKPITPEVIPGLTKEDAEKELINRGYTRYKTYEIRDPKFENAEAEVDNIKKNKFELGASTPAGLFSHVLQSAGSFSIPDLLSDYDNCLTGGIKILEKYGAEMPYAGFWSLTTPKGYYERFSGEEEYVWSSTENKYVSTATGTPSKSSSEGSDLGGINFTSIKLNYISVNADHESGLNFDIILKAQKTNDTSLGIDPINSTLIGATAFITGLAVPNEKFWVNLMPWEPDRIIDEELSQSEVGRIMLEADLQVKKDFANYGNPCANETGKALWDLLDAKRVTLVQWCMNKYPGEIKNIDNIYFRPVTRFWIVPDKIYAYTNDTAIYIINASLDIESEAVIDHASFEVNNQDPEALSSCCLEELNKSAKEYNRYVTELEDSLILPYVVSDVNHAAKYEDLRNVYVSLALAQWYKSNITSKQDIFQENLNSSDFSALDGEGKQSPYEIWEDFVYSCENGEYKCWENTTSKSQLRSGGGVEFYNINEKLVAQGGAPTEVQDIVEEAIEKGYVDKGPDVVFGIRLHGDLSHDTTTSGSRSTETAIIQDPNLAITWNNKGNTLYNQGNYDDAFEAYDEAIRRDPTLAMAWVNKGNALVNLGKYDDAIEAYNEAIRLDSNLETARSNLAITWINKGNKLYNQRKYEDAIKAYDEAIMLAPDSASAWFNKGIVLYSQEKYAEALVCFEETINLDPDFEAAWNYKDITLESLGMASEDYAAHDRSQDISESRSIYGIAPTPPITDTITEFNETAINVTCPEGWMGPDENGECWKFEITS